MERGARTIARRGGIDRPRRGSTHLPPDVSGGRGSQPSTRGRTPSAEHKGFARYPVPRRVTSLGDYISDPNLLRGQGTKWTQHDLTYYKTGSQGHYAKSLLSPAQKPEKKGRSPSPEVAASGAGGKVPEAQATVSSAVGGSGKGKAEEASGSAAASAPGTRSWADIAKKRLPTEVSGGAQSARDLSSEHRAAATAAAKEPQQQQQRPTTAAVSSVSGSGESAKLQKRSGQQGAVNIDAESTDPAVRGYSFFFDPNEPTGTSVGGQQPKTDAPAAGSEQQSAAPAAQRPKVRMTVHIWIFSPRTKMGC
ncbi:unnamed protein product [Gongylonema pulchrum]|uniref:Flagellar associated n=1 Tax=Gongylonema pulchrum TaxID=637853 RepID=A0A183EJ18_9BILA|nr:unnamed protein product [Gongylonema pulchrum]